MTEIDLGLVQRRPGLDDLRLGGFDGRFGCVGIAFGGFEIGGRKQIAFALLPVAALSLVAVCCGVTAVKRRPADRWVSALAVAGTVVGAIVLLMVVTGLFVSWLNDPVGNTD